MILGCGRNTPSDSDKEPELVFRLASGMNPNTKLWEPANLFKQALLLGVIIFAGIILGIFTATEASAVAVIYAAFIGFFVHKKLKLKDLPGICYLQQN